MGITINQKRKGWRKGAGIIIVVEVDVLLFTRHANEKGKKIFFSRDIMMCLNFFFPSRVSGFRYF